MRGFTLIELLVSIAIIVVLSTIGMRVFSGIMENRDDARRQSDLSTVAQALELYRHEQRGYPASLTFGCGGDVIALSEGTKSYMSQLPSDPNCPTSNYQYHAYKLSEDCTAAPCDNYVLCAAVDGNRTYDIPQGCTLLNCAGTPGDCKMGFSSP